MTNAVIHRLATRLSEAQPSWQARGIEARVRVMRDWRASLESHRQAIVDALIQDTGRRLISHSEFDGTLRRMDYWAERAPRLLARVSEGASATAPSVRYRHTWHPLGTLGIISPWNVPLLLSLIDALPALLAGCSVLLKPSEVTPRFIAPLRASVQAVPALSEVFELVCGDGAVGEAMVDVVDAVCFTGSTRTGRKVASRAAARLIPAFLELGGKDPLVVLAGADLELAVQAALRGSILNTGQACQSIERLYVQQDIYPAFVNSLVQQAKAVRLINRKVDGDVATGSGAGHLGPFIDPRQADTLQAHLDDALEQGAKLHCGEILHRPEGVWCSPVVLTEVNHDMRIMQEETFAPVMPVMPFATQEQAIALANDSRYGLSAAVMGPPEQATEVAMCIRAGAVSINDCGLTTQVSDVEKDAFVDSGLGASRMGDAGFFRFLKKQALLIQTGAVLPIDAFAED